MNLQVPPELEAKLTRLAAETGRTVDQVAQASLDYKQRLQQLFFPEGVAFDGNRFNRTALTAPLFKYLAPPESADERVVTQIFTSWNRMAAWLRQIEGLRRAA